MTDTEAWSEIELGLRRMALTMKDLETVDALRAWWDDLCCNGVTDLNAERLGTAFTSADVTKIFSGIERLVSPVAAHSYSCTLVQLLADTAARTCSCPPIEPYWPRYSCPRVQLPAGATARMYGCPPIESPAGRAVPAGCTDLVTVVPADTVVPATAARRLQLHACTARSRRRCNYTGRGTAVRR